MDLSDYLLKASFCSAFIPAATALLLFRKTPKALRILSAFAFINIVAEIISSTLSRNFINNMPVFHLHTMIEFLFVVYLASKIIDTKSFYRFSLASGLIFLSFCITNALFIEGFEEPNFLPRGIEGLTVIGICVYFFYRLFAAEESLDLLKYPYFWLFASWLIYFSGTFFLFIYRNSSGFGIAFPIIHSILNIFLNLVYTYTLWLGSRKSTSQ